MTPYSDIPLAQHQRNDIRTFLSSTGQKHFKITDKARGDWSMFDCYYSSAGYLPVTYSSSPILLQSEWVNRHYVVATSKFQGGSSPDEIRTRVSARHRKWRTKTMLLSHFLPHHVPNESSQRQTIAPLLGNISDIFSSKQHFLIFIRRSNKYIIFFSIKYTHKTQL